MPHRDVASETTFYKFFKDNVRFVEANLWPGGGVVVNLGGQSRARQASRLDSLAGQSRHGGVVHDGFGGLCLAGRDNFVLRRTGVTRATGKRKRSDGSNSKK